MAIINRPDYVVNTLYGVEVSKNYRQCRTCKKVKHIDEFLSKKKPKGGLEENRTLGEIDNECKACKHVHTKLSRKYRKTKKHLFNGHCEYCNTELEFDKAHVDHSHETHEFRGWLCNNCNVGLGRLGDNEEGLLKGVEYLRMAKKRNEESNVIPFNEKGEE